MRVIHADRQEILGREVEGKWTTSLQVRGFAQLIQHFIDCVQKRETPLTIATDAYRTQVLLEEMVAKEV